MDQVNVRASHEVPSEKRCYTVEEIASILDIGMNSAYQLVKEGHFHVVRIGKGIRISKRSFDEWLDSNS